MKVDGYMSPLDFAMDAGDSMSASNGSQFSHKSDNKSGAGCVGMHQNYPGW